MKIKPEPPTSALASALVTLFTVGCPSLGVDPLFPGIPVYRDDEPANLVAPYIIIDLTLEPVPWGHTALWAYPISLHLVQPLAIPDLGVSLDYDSSSADAYEENFRSLIFGRWPISGTAYVANRRNTFATLSDLLTAIATDAASGLVLVDTAQLHRPDCPDAGLPTVAKVPTTTDNEVEITFRLVAALTDADLAA